MRSRRFLNQNIDDASVDMVRALLEPDIVEVVTVLVARATGRYRHRKTVMRDGKSRSRMEVMPPDTRAAEVVMNYYFGKPAQDVNMQEGKTKTPAQRYLESVLEQRHSPDTLDEVIQMPGGNPVVTLEDGGSNDGENGDAGAPGGGDTEA